MDIKKILIFIIVLLVGDCIRMYYKKEDFQDRKVLSSRPSKCFDCEQQIAKTEGISNVWKAQPSKCFSCEQQYKKTGINPGLAGPSKCFDCEKQIESKILDYKLSPPRTSSI